MTPETAKAIADFLLVSIEHEFPTTKKVIGATPDERLDWRPHPKGMTAGDLAWHISMGHVMFLEGIATQKFVLQEPPPRPKTIAEMLAVYEQRSPELTARIKALPAEKLAANTKCAIFDFPLFTYLHMLLAHEIHHRGQLSAYLRAMGEKVPSIYGGSADEPFEMPANAT